MLLRTVWAKDDNFGAAIRVDEVVLTSGIAEVDLNLICAKPLGLSSL